MYKRHIFKQADLCSMDIGLSYVYRSFLHSPFHFHSLLIFLFEGLNKHFQAVPLSLGKIRKIPVNVTYDYFTLSFYGSVQFFNVLSVLINFYDLGWGIS